MTSCSDGLYVYYVYLHSIRLQRISMNTNATDVEYNYPPATLVTSVANRRGLKQHYCSAQKI